MNNSPQLQAQEPGVLHPATRIGHVHLSVADLDRQLAFYQDVLGFMLHWRDGDSAGLGAGGRDLLRLTEVPGGQRISGTTGLYHFAVLFPNRRELARAVARLFSLHYRNYPTDHVMTKTTYLDDPEGQNIELYADTPEDGVFGLVDGALVARHADGTLSDGREPLDVEALLRQLEPGDSLEQSLPPGTTIGHVHLYVADLDATMRFYHDLLGLDNMGLARAFRMGMVSAGGYHHHIGFNTWVGEGAPPPPPGSLGLRYFTVVLPDRSELDSAVGRLQRAGVEIVQNESGLLVQDPSHNGVLLTIGNKR
ncbi:MAG TPA: VOC family protein [Anaerolineales bacterium]|nr:VOC family protein [Anaerolineales bacterium]